ncbi:MULTISPECIES: DUF397 domain-containing protein [unclassified Micromonospora]|uniref:DUF397 domain-containing protein n=1 Tax=unclassified Micromonospora TaxID=2617518 RepID=UPI003A85D0F1
MTEHTPARGWYTSSRSANNAACVEVRLGADTIGVRDSKDRGGPALAFDPAAWTGFLTTIKATDPH